MNAGTEGPDWKRKTFSLPTSLAEWVDRRAARGEASAYIAGLIEADRQRELARAELREFGYSGDMEITDEGRAAARALLDRQAASRAARRRKHNAA
ncbi:hypothetical protein GCM10009682_28870 [Luedemannella flava]|uniref:CopG family transcriptional regulator n=1 Tax=Luedemannella flava TaxID=349316 RepID=A0ABN2M1G6_9ACTN